MLNGQVAILNGNHNSNGHHVLAEGELYPPQLVGQAIEWAKEAGKISMDYFKNVTATFKADDTLVTKADVEIETYLVNQIRSHYPDHWLIGEEGTSEQTTNSPYTWAIDPLDGTTAFVQGLPGWGISIGLMYHNQPVFGLFYMPMLDDMTYVTGHGLYCNENLLQHTVHADWGRRGFLAISNGAHRDFEIDVLRSRSLGSVGASLIYTARGSATAALVPKAYLWDLVAGACILHQVGGELRYLSGKPVDYDYLLQGHRTPEPILAGHPLMLTQLQTAIQPRTV